MRKIETNLPGVYILEPKIFGDERGFFFESYNKNTLKELGIVNDFIQDNHSKSRRGTLRGLHYQIKYPQAKLCRVVQGEVLDVVVDIRYASPTFGQYVSVLLSADNKKQVFIPQGFAHGFVVLSDTAEFLYKCDEFYHPEDEGGVLWNDSDLGIDWELNMEPLLSGKDKANLPLSQIPKEKLPRYK